MNQKRITNQILTQELSLNSTLNYLFNISNMKKLFSYLLISSMVVLSSCTNYDDQFDDLNSQINSLKGQIEGFSSLSSGLTALQGTVASLQSAVANIPVTPATDISGLESDLDGLSASLAAMTTKLEELEAALANASTAAEVAALQTALTAAQADITTILENNNVLSANLVINDAATLAYATALGDKVGIINGNVTITQGSLDTAAVSAVTSKIATVVGTVSITAKAALDFSSLTAVSGNYEVSGADVLDDALTSAANVTLSYGGGYTQPNLATVAALDLDTTSFTSTTTGTTVIDFSGLTSATSVTNNGGTANALTAAVATNINLGAVPVATLTAPKALTVTLGKTATASVTISTASATAVVVGGTAALTGNLNITATGDVTLSTLKTVGGTTTITTGGDLSAPALTTLTGASTITAANVTAPALVTLTGAATINKVDELSLPALTTVSGGLTAANLITLNAPVLAATSTITTASATTMVIKNASNTHVSAGSLENLTIKELATTFDASSLTKLKTLNVTGKASTSNGVTLTSANTAITSVSVDGELDAVSITGTGSSTTDKLTSVTTAGKIDSFTLDNSDTITSLNLGHAHISGGAGSVVVITNNAKLASLTTSTDFMKTLTVTGNPMLTSFDGSSYVTVVNGATTVALTLHSNKLTGLFTEAVAATGTTDYKEAIIASDDLSTIKSYVAAVESATATLTLSVDLSDVNAATGAQTLSSKMYANAGVSTVIVSATSTTTLDSAAEFALVTNE